MRESKAKVAYENGRMDFWAGAPCDPNYPIANLQRFKR
jgi:hypothetical protein